MRPPLQVPAHSLVGVLTPLSTPTRGALCCPGALPKRHTEKWPECKMCKPLYAIYTQQTPFTVKDQIKLNTKSKLSHLVLYSLRADRPVDCVALRPGSFATSPLLLVLKH